MPLKVLRRVRSGPRALFSKLSTGTVLCLIDAVLMLLAWPVVARAVSPSLLSLSTLLLDARFLTFPAFNLMFLFATGLYRRQAIVETKQSLVRVPLVVGIGVVTALLTSVLQTLAVTPGAWPEWHDQAVVVAGAFAAFTMCGFTSRFIIYGLVRNNIIRRHVLIVGAGQRAWDLQHMLRSEGGSLHDDITFLRNANEAVDPRLYADAANQIVCPSGFNVADAARRMKADVVVIAPDERRGMDLRSLLECKRAGFPVVQYLSFVEREIRRVDLKRMEIGWLVYGDGFTFGIMDRALKRIFDVAFSAFMLVLTSPFIAAGMLAVLLDSPGGVLYRQERVTRGGKIFTILKLRTMRTDAEANGPVWAAEKDDRITRVGNFLRRTRIDEFPQLVNILRGDMSFVGPRPERPTFVDELADEIPFYNERHMVKAGLTGWAQINYPYGASVDDARSKLSYDLYYVKNFSLLLDIIILQQTLREVLWPSGVR